MPRRQSIEIALAVAAFVWWRVYAHEMGVGGSGGDFAVYRNAALTLLGGGDPYANTILLYPLPAVLAVVPLIWMHPSVGAATFAALGMLALTYGVARRKGWHGLAILTSPSCFLGWYYLQWSPAIVASAFLPWLAAIGTAKPNLAFAPFAYRPTRLAIGAGLAMLALSFLVLPRWLPEWLADVGKQTTAHPVVVLWPLGFAGLAGLFEWRRAEGRALVAMTLSPLNPQYYDHLAVWLVCRTWKESLTLSFTGWAGFLTFVATAPHDLTRNPTPAYLSVTLGIYVPAALLIVIRSWSSRRRKKLAGDGGH